MATEINLICKKCGTPFSVLGKKNIRSFCNRSCANSRSWTEEDKQNKSKAAKNSQKVLTANQSRISNKITKECKCGSSFLPSKLDQQFCSKACSNIYQKYNTGGYREKSGRSKSGYYNGIYCGSTYELCWVIYNLDHNIKFQRFAGFLANDKIKYYPDFLIDLNQIIEIKGYENPLKVKAKADLAKEKGYDIKILYKNALKAYFEYVKVKYKTERFHTLYDGYKPKYSYQCSLCKKEFNRDKEAKTKNVLCSKICSMKFNRLRLVP